MNAIALSGIIPMLLPVPEFSNDPPAVLLPDPLVFTVFGEVMQSRTVNNTPQDNLFAPATHCLPRFFRYVFDPSTHQNHEGSRDRDHTIGTAELLYTLLFQMFQEDRFLILLRIYRIS